MKTNCDKCPYGPYYNSLSDFCDECMQDPNTGFGGFYDHRIGRGFMSEEEQHQYYKDHYFDDDESDENESII